MADDDIQREVLKALKPFLDCNFTYFNGKVLGTDAKLTRDDVQRARAAIVKLEATLATSAPPRTWPEGAVFTDMEGAFYDEQARPLPVTSAPPAIEAPSREDVQFLIDLAAQDFIPAFTRRTLVRIARQLAATQPKVPSYFCNKCGYSGPVQVDHQRPNGTGECGYMARQLAATTEAKEPNRQLMKFYGVTTLEALVDAQAHHIEKLQGKLPSPPSLAPQRVREG
jgi:hypothetical protein